MIELKRTLGLPSMVLYGLGTTVGAGIYALIGEIAATSGFMAPVAFLLASSFAAFTACSFAELSGRFPRAAGAALYVEQGLGSVRLAQLIGLLVIVAAVVSSAAMMTAFVRYTAGFVELERWQVIVAITLTTGAIACWGIAESVLLAAIVTCLEVGGLVVVLASGLGHFAKLPQALSSASPGLDPSAWGLALSGSLLAFYAFIGFEDMVDLAEEVKDVRRTLPRAILITLGVTVVLYLALMTMAVLAIPPAELGSHDAPLVLLFERNTGLSAAPIGVVGMIAMLNGALIQLIMASRVIYGLASRGQLPGALAHVHPRTQTPLRATLLVTAVILLLALVGRLATLAALTSIVMLTIFAFVNFALWRIKGLQSETEGPSFPRWVPLVGCLVSVGVILHAIAPLASGH